MKKNTFLKIRDEDFSQKEKIYGPGNKYRDWLIKNPEYNFQGQKILQLNIYRYLE